MRKIQTLTFAHLVSDSDYDEVGNNFTKSTCDRNKCQHYVVMSDKMFIKLYGKIFTR